MGRAVVVLGVVAVVVGPGLVAAVPARAAATDCVALVVDPAPGAARTSCVTWSAGLTGLAVLRAGHSVVFRSTDGLVCRIDGTPSTCSADATHYWSYWHRPAGGSSWVYSNQGAGTYQPGRNSTDGWAYQDGSARQPANIAFSTICPQAAPTRTTPRPPPAPPRTSSRPPPATTRSAGPAPPAAPPAGSPHASTARPGAAATGPTPAGTTTARTTSPAPGAAGPTSPAESPAVPVPVAATGGSGGAPVGALIGLMLAAAVAGAGVWFARVRRARQS